MSKGLEDKGKGLCESALEVIIYDWLKFPVDSVTLVQRSHRQRQPLFFEEYLPVDCYSSFYGLENFNEEFLRNYMKGKPSAKYGIFCVLEGQQVWKYGCFSTYWPRSRESKLNRTTGLFSSRNH